MCSILGGTTFDKKALEVYYRAKDRGRDYSNIFERKGAWICNHRAVPTTEVSNTEFNQPFGKDYKVVHNGTIANDKELGNKNGVIDSYILSKMNFTNIDTLLNDLMKVKGSYAIAVMKPNGQFYLACNYKPLFYAINNEEVIFSSYREHLEGLYDNITRLKPYSIFDTETLETRKIPREKLDKVAVIASGGLDSTAVAAYAVATYGKDNVILLHYQYGCIAQEKELNCIKNISSYLGCAYKVIPIDMSFMNGNSSLFKTEDDVHSGISGSEYAYEWVPARNLIMLSLAVGFCEANGYDIIMPGINLEEGGAYPDNEPQFIKDFDNCLYGAVQNGKRVRIEMPVGNLMKHEIVAFGNKYKAPFQFTWSCYRKGEKPCGQCGPCFMRQVAFKRNGLTDPLDYENAGKEVKEVLDLDKENL